MLVRLDCLTKSSFKLLPLTSYTWAQVIESQAMI